MINLSFPKSVEANLLKNLDILKLKAVDGSINPILSHFVVNVADSSAVSNTASLNNFSVNKTISRSIFVIGKMIKLCASGIYSTTGTPTLTFNVRFGTTNLVSFAAKTGINNASNQSWMIEAWIITRTTGSSGTVQCHGRLSINTASGTDTVETVNTASAVTVDTTVNNILQVSLTWSAASTSNTATLKNFIVELSSIG